MWNPCCRAEHNFPILLHDSWADKTVSDWCVDYLDKLAQVNNAIFSLPKEQRDVNM